MKIIISPAKSLDFKSTAPTNLHTQPQFLEQSNKLNKKLKTLSRKKLAELMKISPALADLNYERNQTWQTPFTLENAKQTIYTFTGEVFRGININSLSIESLPILQDSLRILSGLYGVLKPLDLIQPYRLEMGTKLKVGAKDNLYKFWSYQIANSLNNELQEGELFINLASNEYFKVLPKNSLKTTIITPIFKELRGNAYKVIAIFAKKARGLMVRYIINNNINSLEDLKGFNSNGYGFDANLSTGTELVFTR